MGKIITKPLKYALRMTFASFAFAGGMAICRLGYQNENLLFKVGGLISVGWSVYEVGKNTVLSVASNFKNLESKIK